MYYHTVQPFELMNALGNIVAVLEGYNFTKKDETSNQVRVNYIKQQKAIGMIWEKQK